MRRFVTQRSFCSLRSHSHLKANLVHLNQMTQLFARDWKWEIANLNASLTHYKTLDYLSWFARTCLICHKDIDIEEAYRTIKIAITKTKESTTLTPHSCTVLMEAFTHFKFQGDENAVLSRLCQYYEDYYWLFTKKQESHFWVSYLKIMGVKAHSTVKFKPLTRKRQGTIETYSQKEYIELLTQHKLLKVNKDVVKSVRYNKDDKALVDLHSGEVIKIIGIELITKIQDRLEQVKSEIVSAILKKDKPKVQRLENVGIQYDGQSKEGSRIYIMEKQKHVITDQILAINAALSNDSHIVIHGVSEGILRSGPITMSQIESLQAAYHYQDGICYDKSNIKTRKVLHIETLILGIRRKFLQADSKLSIHFLQRQEEISRQIAPYYTLENVQSIVSFSQTYLLHWNIFNLYNRLQNWKANSQIEKQKRQLGLYQDEEGEEEQEEDTAFNKEKAQQLTELTLKKAKDISAIKFNPQAYDNNLKGRKLLDLISYLHWGLRPLLADAKRIYGVCQELGQEKSKKVMLVTEKQDSRLLLSYLLEGKFVQPSGEDDGLSDIKQMLLDRILQPIPDSKPSPL